MNRSKLMAPRLLVLLDDGKEYDIQTTLGSMRRYEAVAARYKWPAMQDAPLLSLSFIAYDALKREGVIKENDIEAGMDRIVNINQLDVDGNIVGEDSLGDLPEVNPTPQTA